MASSMLIVRSDRAFSGHISSSVPPGAYFASARRYAAVGANGPDFHGDPPHGMDFAAADQGRLAPHPAAVSEPALPKKRAMIAAIPGSEVPFLTRRFLVMGSHGILSGHRRFARRGFLRGTAAAALAGLAAPALIGRARADGVVLNFATYGGVLNEHLTRLFTVPFEKQTGIRVNLGGNASLALAKLQTTSGTAAQWDLINLTGAEYLAAIDENIVAPYDYSIVDASYIEPAFKGTHGIKFTLFLFGMAYDKRKLPEDKAPKNWAEFWDTQRFPGKRSLYSNPSDGSVLEIALLADGVPIDKLYPLDVERALKSLDKLGRQNIIWHSTNQEPIQQMTSGAVSLAT